MRVRPAAIFALLVIGLLMSITVATAVGVVRLPLLDSAKIILAQMFRLSFEGDPAHEAVIWAIRLPRVIVAGLVGFSLAISGAAMQGLFKNPLASPGIIGLASGGSLGAVIAIYIGLPLYFTWSVPLFAFVGALVASLLAYMLATRGGTTDAASLLLAGVALSSLFSGGISFIYHFVDDGVLRQIVYWLMGNLSGKRWDHVGLIAPFIFFGSLGLMMHSTELNLLAGGEEDAASLGVSVEKVKRRILVFVSLTTGAAVSVVGAIGFVGLVVPHMMRLLIGPDHRRLLPASGLLGASFLILCDLMARTAFSPVELRTGIVTAFFGVPFFLYLLYNSRRV